MAKQMSKYVEDNNLFSPLQSGFREQHSCSTAMVKILDDIRIQFDKDLITTLCLLDFSKAFDRVNHKILCLKLRMYFGFSQQSVRLISNYLNNRSQRVSVGSNYSNYIGLSSGVPQGSILGPILFCLFINDLPKVCKNVSLHLYADDVQLYLSRPIGLIEDLVCRLNEDLNSIYKWSINNGLTLNPTKSQCIVISKSHYDIDIFPQVYLGHIPLTFVDKVTNLGFKINRYLSATDHVNFTVGRIYATLRKLWLSADFTPLDTRLRLVKTLILPIIDYAVVIYCKLDSHSQHKLLVSFNDAVRYIYGLRRFDHISHYHRMVLGCTLSEFFEARCRIFMHKIIHNKLPSYLSSKIQFAQSSRTLNLITPISHYLTTSRLFFVHATRLWNALPTQVKQLTGSKQFKNKIFNYDNRQLYLTF